MTATLPALVEGNLEAAVLPEIFRQLGLGDSMLRVRIAGGGMRFWREAIRYNEAAKHKTMIGLADLEQAPCAAELLHQRLPAGRLPTFHLRLAVRMLDGWLMADREAFARWLGVSVALIPPSPDDEPHPKRRVVELAGRSSKKRIRESLMPLETGASVGAEYVPVMADYAKTRWSVLRAAERSPSLKRACARWQTLRFS